MDFWRSQLRDARNKKPPRRSYSIYRKMPEGDGDPEGLQMKVVEAERPGATRGGEKAGDRAQGPWKDRWKAVVCLVLVGLLVFIVAFLLGYVLSRGSSCMVCGDYLAVVNDESPPEAEDGQRGAPLYWADLREMFQKYLNEEKIEGTIRFHS